MLTRDDFAVVAKPYKGRFAKQVIGLRRDGFNDSKLFVKTERGFEFVCDVPYRVKTKRQLIDWVRHNLKKKEKVDHKGNVPFAHLRGREQWDRQWENQFKPQ